MHFSSSLIALVAAFPGLISAAPARSYGKRNAGASDILVFKFADVLEQLEATFYTQALAKFQDSDFVTAGFPSPQVAIEQLSQIQADESTHSTVLQAALKSFGEEPITSCKFNFDSVLTDVTTMAVVARVVETVGVGAYLGGSTLLTDPVLLTSAASILTVEARHQTILNVLSGSGTAIPSAFDIALTPSEVLALAGPFFDGPCDLGIPANPGLSLTNTGSVGVGTQLSFTSPAITSANDTSKFFCQMLVGGAFSSIALPFDNCVVPAGINGPVAIFITSDGQPLLNNVRDRATTQLVAGPLMAFIDTQPQMLGQLARQGSDSNSPSSTSTRTISPAEASSIIATDAASATPAPTGAASATDSAATASSTDAASSQVLSASAPSTPGKPNAFVGKSADGSIGVLGWSNLPSN
ncbi:hypothetical protein D9619_001244 [Psilocybe cf. subviscida]|uniref:Ferritin-like domain-containing protein n=1 Tax=Psilocybe cf. subviscida TaxID=2480587 RepID=A0A8H5BGY6_9AGAR|nr:hypothetical protein D9619_001244 [Psilocybe cf. subviscida]